MAKEKPDPEQENDKLPPQQETAADKFFNENEYNTITIQPGETDSALGQPNMVRTLLSLLDSGSAEDKENALDLLKKENGVSFLMEAIRATDNTDKKAVLLAACWESGLDFKGHHDFFMDYAFHQNPLISLEAITVLDTNRLGIPREELPGLIERLSAPAAAKHDNAVLLEDLRADLAAQLEEA